MKKRLVKIGIVCIVLGLLGYLGYKVVSKIGYKKEVKERLQSIPPFSFVDVKNNRAFTHQNIPTKRATIFVYFDKDCDYCQHEAEELKKHIAELKNTTILFVSRNSIASIKEFAINYGLENYKNVHFLFDAEDTFHLQFDATSIPYMLVYGKNREIIMRNKGQLKIAPIIQKIREADE